MRKKLFTFLLALAASVGLMNAAVDGKLPGAFSVSGTKVVYFSQGNLQYQASTNTWRFAENQYEAVGASNGSGNVAPYNNTSSANHSPSASQTGWIDLFGWAASGIDRTDVNAYQPYSTSETDTDYGTTATKSASETLGNYDWGKNMGDDWRTLTADEWGYLIGPGNSGTNPSGQRANYQSLRGLCYITVGSTSYPGMIILPDDLYNNLPTATEGDIATKWAACAVAAGNSLQYTNATFTEKEWTALQDAGAVFLPAAGFRNGTTVYYAGANGNYWSSSASSSTNAFYLYFRAGFLLPEYSNYRNSGRSVRLVSETAPSPAPANSCGDGLTWELNAGVFTISYDGVGTGVMDDFDYSEHPAPWQSSKESITSVIIPDGVTRIGNNAFSGAYNLASVSMGDDVVAIGNNAFEACNSLSSITLSSHVTTIGDHAFAGLQSLTSIVLPSTVQSIGTSAFYGNEGLTSITCEGTTPPTLGQYVFGMIGNGATLYVPYGYAKTYESADSQWQALNIQVIGSGSASYPYCGDGLTWTYNNGVLTIIYDGVGTGDMLDYGNYNIYPWDSYKDDITSVIIPDGVIRIGNYAFANLINLASVSMGDDVVEIGYGGFWNCLSLQSITLGSHVTTIGEHAFGSNQALTSITLPNTLQTIGGSAFYNCSSLPTITIPSSVTSFGEYAFGMCEGLTSFTCEGTTPPTLGQDVFTMVPYHRPLYVPDGYVETYQGADSQWQRFDISIIPAPTPDPEPTPSATGGIFANCYDCWRAPEYPTNSGQCRLYNFGNPYVGNNNPSGPWKLEFVGNYDSSSSEYDSNIVGNYAASQYGKTPEQMEVYRLYQWQNGAYQPVAYGVLYAYANESNPVEHAAFFEAGGHWGCYFTDNTHSGGDDFNITFNEDASTGFADLHGSTPTPAVDPTPTPSGDGDKLAGAFSVGGDKVVYFSKANLQATTADNGATWTWGFAENQWDYVGNSAANNAINGGGTVSTNGAVDLFAWSSTDNDYFGINNSINEADYSGDFKDWGAKKGSDWRTLTINEWQYLLQERNPGSSSANHTSYPRYTNAQILTDGTAPQKDIKGIILFPDDFNDGGESIDGVTWGSINPSFFSSDPTYCTTAGWATLESMGCVFLPSAGSRQNFGDEFSILEVNQMGNYWSSTLYSGEPEYPQSIAVGGSTLGIGTSARYWGMSVRLVSETAPSGGSTSAGLQVTKLEVPGSWENDQTLVTISDLPGFVAVSLEEAGAWDAVPTGDVVLIYAGTNEGVTATYFHNGAWGDPVPFGGFSRADIFEWASGSKIFYTSGGSTPAVDPAVQNVIDLINAIPNPVVYNQECFNAINAVYDAYVALTEEQRDQVTNYDDYLAAEERYYMLGSVNYVIETINEIGNVEFTPACKHRIDYARSEYCNLTLEAKGYVTNYNTLLAAEAAYAALIPVSSTVEWDEAILETIDADEWGEATYTNGSLSLKAVDGRARYVDDEEHFLFDGSNSEKSFVFSCTSANILCIEITVSEKHEHNELSCAWQETATGYRWVGEATSVDLASTIFKVTGIRFSLGEAFPEPTPTPAQDGDKLPGAFSVSGGKVVYFSKGNLQYLGNIDRWHFAENQWTIIGNAQASDNRDLFSWGTGDNPDSEDYSTYTEWGNNIEGNWRTLTFDEWTYLFNTRTDASSKYGTATVAGVVGLILLPDNYDGTAINTERTAWDNNVISSSEWAAYEAEGAVFLPAAGLSDAFGVYGVGEQGFYWSSTMDALSYNAISIFYGFNYWEGYWFNQVDAQFQPQEGHSVRLVSETAPTPASTPNSIVINGTPAVGDNSISLTYYFDPANVPGICCNAPTLKVKCAADNKWDEIWLSLSEISSGTTTITLDELGSLQEGKSYDVCFAYNNGGWVDDVFQTLDFNPTPTPAVVIGDPNNASEVETFLSTYDGHTIDELIIDRPVYNNMYNTLCLPFDMNATQIAASSLNGVEIREFTGASVEGTTLNLSVGDPVNAVVAGRPYFVKFSAASQLDDLHFEDVTINNALLDNMAVTFDGVTFKGTFTPFVMPNGLNFQGGYLFLGQNNQLFWPNTSNPLKPFRAYFYVDVESSTPGNAPKYRGMPARIVEGKNVTTGVENAQSANQSTKVIVNGQLIIIKNDVHYNAQGQIVK